MLSHFFPPNASNSHFSLPSDSIFVKVRTSLTHLFWFDFDPSVFEWEDPAPCLLIASIPAGKNKHNGQVLWILGGAISQVLSGDGTYGPVQKQSSQVVECLNLGWNFKVCVSVLELWVVFFFLNV